MIKLKSHQKIFDKQITNVSMVVIFLLGNFSSFSHKAALKAMKNAYAHVLPEVP